jgi:uroporphyrinogen decarboxylase
MGKREPDRVHFAELLVDIEVISFVAEKLKMNLKFSPNIAQPAITSSQLTEEEGIHMKSIISYYYHMNYDCVYVRLPLAPIAYKTRSTDDTAVLSRGKREWTEEKEGIITSWEAFERFPWKRLELDVSGFFSFLGKNLPKGMKVTVGLALYEMVGEWYMGWEGMFRTLYRDPALVKAIIDRMGEITYRGYKEAVSHDCVGAIFHPDDLGYKKGLMVKPEVLREMVFPWFKKYASLAHEHGKMYWYHCCGNVSQVMEDLIEDVKIDAFHSFQDVIMPVWEFKKKYGDRIAVLGGVDVDKLARYDEDSLKKYVKEVLDKCMPDGRYALGSGNTVANYVPPQNYLTMLQEGLEWKP